MYHAHCTPRNREIKKSTNDNSPMIISPHHHLLHSFESNSNFTGDWAADVSCIHTCVHCWTFLQCSGSHCTTVLFSRGQCITLHRDSEGIGLMYHVHCRTTAAHSVKINNSTGAQLRSTAVQNYKDAKKYKIQ